MIMPHPTAKTGEVEAGEHGHPVEMAEEEEEGGRVVSGEVAPNKVLAEAAV